MICLFISRRRCFWKFLISCRLQIPFQALQNQRACHVSERAVQAAHRQADDVSVGEHQRTGVGRIVACRPAKDNIHYSLVGLFLLEVIPHDAFHCRPRHKWPFGDLLAHDGHVDKADTFSCSYMERRNRL